MGAKIAIKRNDIVIAIRGKEAVAKRTGKVLQVIPERGRAIVEGMNLIKKHTRKSQDNPQGAIVTKEAPIAVPSLALFCPRCKKGVRVSRKREPGRRAIRSCRLCGHAFD